MTDLFSPLTLASGVTLDNRIVKAAMEENMADYGQVPGKALERLYSRWGQGGAGTIITGNVMVSPHAMTGPGGVYLGAGSLNHGPTRARFERWAKAAKSGGAKLVMQINHPGRQVYASMGTDIVSASATKLNMSGPAEKMFSQARALREEEIHDLITRFADTSEAAKEAGFDGVQIHAAHGYLMSQFLSPLTNLREDEWGGSLSNRARFLISILRAVRTRVGDNFIVSVKINSADFQKGGFDIGDAKQVVEWLNDENVDFVELSGGNYESAAMIGASDDNRAQSTVEREMYFIDFAKDISQSATMPIMVTGGVTQKQTAVDALADGEVDLIGLARGFGYNPNLAADWKAGKNELLSMPVIKSTNKTFKSLAAMAMTKVSLVRMGNGKPPKVKQSPLLAVIKAQIKQGKQTRSYQKWLSERG